MNEHNLLKGLSYIDDSYVQKAQYPEKTRKSRPALLRWISVAAVLCLIIGLLVPRDNMFLSVRAEDLMEGITARPVEAVGLMDDKAAVTDFAVRLLQASNQSGENTLISPISVLYALAMTANGAKGETLAEMEAVLGMSVDDLNGWLYTYANSINQSELKLANSIWFTEQDGLKVIRSFLQKNADYYGADIFQAPFDETTLEDINNWVSYHTDGMIPKMLDEIPDDALMYLINALCFEANWETKYLDYQVGEDFFVPENEKGILVEFLYSKEDMFVHDQLAKGFIKPYEGGRYAFLAMLPNEGVTVEQYLNSLTGEGLQDILDSAEHIDVHVSMPKFETEFSLEMSAALKQMGMELAFDGDQANFSGIGSSELKNIYIDRVLHKTYICVDEQGTRAAASTSIGMTTAAAAPRYETVDLDRPFVYMIVDVLTGLPVFIGTMMNPSN